MKSVILFSVIFQCLVSVLPAQNPNSVQDLSTYVERIDTFNRCYPHEKIYLHFDNTSYFLGDTLWFKAYVVDATLHKADDWSRTLYVELLTQEGDIIATKKYKTTDGQCHGFLALRDTLWGGYYEVRAYTRWMLNFGPGHEFSRVFPVFDKPRREGDLSRRMTRRSFDVPDYRKDDPWKWEKKGDRVGMDFFPEGGHLVKGLPCRVAFKAVARDSGNLNVRGWVYDASGNNVAYFSTVHDGMGVFDLTPNEESYTAEIEVGGRSWKFPLPTVEREGASLRPEIFDPKTIRLSIYRSDSLRTQTLGITAMCRGRVYMAAQVLPSSQNTSLLLLSRDELPSGVCQITLFDVTGNVLAERLVFVDHSDGLQMSLTQDKEVYKPFEKVDLRIDVRDQVGQPVPTSFSLAVRDGERSLQGNGSDILSYLLLSSEIRGYVHQPNYYFEEKSRERQYALDLLLMIQGWSRYVWKQMAGVERFAISQPAEENISMDGVVQEFSRKFKPVKDAEVRMWMTGNGQSFKETTQTDENGNFVFAFDFWGTYKLSLQVKENGKLKNCDIRLNRFFGPPLRRLSFYEKQFSKENLAKQVTKVTDTTGVFRPGGIEQKAEKSKDVAREYTLKEVTVKGKRVVRLEDEGLKNASAAYYLDPVLDKLKDQGQDKATTLFELLAQMNPYYHTQRPIDTSDSYKSRPILYIVNNSVISAIPIEEIVLDRIKLISIDETPGAACFYIDCRDVKQMDLVVVHIYTDNRLRATPIGIRTTQIEGYALTKEFYNPRYDREVLPGETDYRRTLYWNPNVRTDSLGQAKIIFYNNGSCKQMNISAQTVTSDGRIGTTGQ